MVLVLAAFAMGACKRKQQLVQTTSSESTVSNESGVTPRDTTLQAPGAHVEGTVPLPPPGMDLPPDTVRSGKAWSAVAVSNGRIKHSGGCDTTSLVARLWDTWTRSHSVRTEVRELVRTEQVEVPYTPKWVWWTLLLGIAGTVKLLWPFVAKLLKFLKPLF